MTRLVCTIATVSMLAVCVTVNASEDFSGVWMRRNDQRHLNYAFSAELPLMTPWAQERFDAAKPTFGDRSVPAAGSNDLVY